MDKIHELSRAKEEKYQKTRRTYTLLVVITPIMCVYKSLAPGIDLATFIFLAFSLRIFIAAKGKISIVKPLIAFFVYVIISTLVSLQMQESFSIFSIVLRLGKYLMVIFLVIIIGNRQLFDVDYGFKLLKRVTLMAVGYIFLQTIMYRAAGILLPNAIMSLVSYQEYAEIDYERLAEHFYRPTAFFVEPSSYCQYTLLYLSFSVFGWKGEKLVHNWKIAAAITFGILLSGSGQGIMMAVLIWVMWFLKRLVFTKLQMKNLVVLVSLVLVLAVSSPFLMQSELVSKPLERVFTDNKEGGGNAFMGRMGGYMYFGMLPNTFKLIGMGYGNVPKDVYFNSLSYTLYCNGILGCLLLVYLFGDIVIKGTGFQKVFGMIYFGLLAGATTFTATNICFYFSFIYNGRIRERVLNNDYPGI